MMLIPALLLVLACLAAEGCLLFTQAVNSPPTGHDPAPQRAP